MIEPVIKIALEVGKVIMKSYYDRKVFYLGKKEDCSPVTSVDLIANSYIVFALQKLTPDIPILSEEDTSLWSKSETVDCFWVVDPLDGTKEFLSGSCEFTVNIALVEKGIPVMGVVYAPAMGILYAGINNNQAWKMDVNTQYRIVIRSCKGYPPVIVVSRFHNNLKRLKSYLMNLTDYNIITVGSSLKFCLVAEGIAQMYPRFSCTNIWDIAAGHAVVLSAGAVMTDWCGSVFNYKDVIRYSSFLNSGFHVFVL